MNMKKIVIMVVGVILIILTALLYINYEKKQKIEKIKIEEKELLLDIKKVYSDSVKTTKKATLYKYENKKYNEVGYVGDNQILSLDEIDELTLNNKYFKIKGLEYYVSYKDIKPSKEDIIKNNDYKNYIPFGDIVETANVNLYNDDKIVYNINDKLKFEVIIKDEDKYYVEFNNELLYLNKNDIKNIEEVEIKKEIAKEITVLNYHFFYEDENNVCNEILCVSRSNFDAQLKHLHDNNYYTLTARELELFLDKKINLPKKSVLITVDDGACGTTTVLPETLKKYGMRATLFLITSFNDYKMFEKFDNIELHSHSDNMHNVGICSGGQGGGIKCLPEKQVMDDLQITKDLLNDTRYFAYPFYEYNDRAVKILEKSGFTMAFIGGNKKVKPGDNKMLLNRYLMFDTTSMSDFLRKL